MGWSVSEDLLCVADDGSVLVYDIHGAIKKTLTMGQVSHRIHFFFFFIKLSHNHVTINKCLLKL